MFKTRCTIKGKVCDLMIDSGCTENVISRSVVQALQLKTSRNHHLYKVRGIKKGMEVTVTDMCRVSFLIGKHYVCDVLCDVIDMDIFYLILGRPWQYDMDATYNCRQNVYTLDLKGKKLRLFPHNNSTSNADKNPNVIFITTGKLLVQSRQDVNSLLALVVSYSGKESKPACCPVEIQAL